MDGDDFDIDNEIDWVELQEFFLDDLRSKLFDMEQRCTDRDTDTLLRLGHSLKGSGGGVKLPRFTELGKSLEVAGKALDLDACVVACRALRDEYLLHRPTETKELSELFQSRGRAAA